MLQPEEILESYPLVTGVKTFDKLENAADYVLFDPAAGNNRFTVLGEVTSDLMNLLVFSQRFRRIGDGVTFEQVFTGNVPPVEGMVQRVSGTLTFGLRRYEETKGFVPMELPRENLHFFATDPFRIKNQGTLGRYAAKWAIGPDRPPITWVISGLAEQVRKEPRLAEYDFTSAIKSGIEAWNQAFGFKALEARVAKEGEAYGQDDLNFLIFDTDLAADAAFANRRYNPNTGEIRGASVYLPLIMVDDLIPETAMAAPANTTAAGTAAAEVPPNFGRRDRAESLAVGLRWSDQQVPDQCDLALHSLEAMEKLAAKEEMKGMSKKDVVERQLAWVVTHEIGHTLGLRHNFKGSLSSPSTSVMDYLQVAEASAMGGSPGPYDVAAIRFLYGLSTMPPAQVFCTDEHVNLDADCQTFDKGATPLTQHFIPAFNARIDLVLAGLIRPTIAGPVIDQMVPFVRNGTDPLARVAAYQAAMAPLNKPIGPMVKAPLRELVTKEVLERLFLRPLPTRMPTPPQLTAAPKPPAEPVLAAAVADLKAYIIDSEGTRHMTMRRTSTDMLKRFQHASAAAGLMEARMALIAKLAMLQGTAAIETMDLVNRIDKHLQVYFD